MLTATLPWPPSANHAWKHSRGRHFLTAKARKYRETVKAALYGLGKFEGPVEVQMLAYPPDRRRRDLDNLVKQIFDAITDSGVWADDSLVHALAIRRAGIYTRGKIELAIFPAKL